LKNSDVNRRIFLLALACACLPLRARASPKFVPNSRGLLFLKGPSASFDLHSSNVYLKQAKTNNRNLMIYAHGGAGLRQADSKRAKLFERFGFDVMSFDAFAMNKLDPLWVNKNLSDEAKQQLVINVLTGAIRYANSLQHYENIVLFGQSNGARAILVILNELAPADKRKIRMIISEAPSSHGKALPNQHEIPIHLFVGSLDNWGGKSVSDLMWKRFNYLTRGTNETWFEQQILKGNPINLTVYEDAGHSFHDGPLREIERKLTGMGKTLGYLGANPEVVQNYEKALQKLIKPFTQ